ncbi:MAG: hypothetical protein JWL95_2382 [Gemmatimonadetes bacterium]|nr:hypothetical protein [Gemmatimonadota bacterium]
MRSHRLISLASLGFAVATVATVVASPAGAQSRSQVTVCRDGTQVASDDTRSCNRHRGVDDRATSDARRAEARRTASDRGYGRDGRQNSDPRYDDRNNGGDNRRNNGVDDSRNNGRGNRGQNDNGYGNNNGNGYGNNNGNGRNEVYEWQGTVDAEVQFQLRGNRAVQQLVGRNERRSGRGQLVNAIPQREGRLVVESVEGRGSVDVIEQPTSRNGYTATVRVRDPQGGAAHYRFVAYWEPTQSTYGRYNSSRP